jgi:hypothetical protein
MKYFPAAARIVLESLPFHLPAAGGCGVVRRRLGMGDDPVSLPAADELLPVARRLGTGPHLRLQA